MPISDWKDLMPHTVTHKPVSSRDDYGKPTFGSSTSYSARVSYTTKRVASRVTGDDVLSTVQVWINGTPSLTIDDEITLPDGTSPKIQNWDLVPDEDGSHHVKIYLSG